MDKSTLRVETHRSGPFVFQVGLDMAFLEPLRARVEEAYAFIAPTVGPSSLGVYSGQFRNLPEGIFDFAKLVHVTSVYGSNTIEGGLLSEKETEEVLSLPFDQIKEEEQQRVVNLKKAYEFASAHANAKLDEKNIKIIHAIVTDKLSHSQNKPGEYRNNTKENLTYVGDAQHGGVYKPPKCLDDIKILMKDFVKWINSEDLLKLSPLYRAPLAHFYFELIHPFWDGNGRTGRVIEAMLLQANYDYAPHAISGFYLKNVDQYFTVFNECRKKAESKRSFPNTDFVAYFLERLLDTFYYLYDKRNEFYSVMAFSAHLVRLSGEGKINKRQEAIVFYLRKSKVTDKKLLESEPWYQALYSDYHPKTKERDLKQLQTLNLISVENNQIQIIDLFPKRRLSKG